MKRTAKKIANMLALFALCITLGLCALACGNTEKPPQNEPVPPVKVSDGIDFEVAAGKSKNLTVADYITVNDYTPSAESDSENATVALAQGLLTVTGVSEGNATVTLSCDEITVTFGVTVFTEYCVTVDGVATYVRKGGTFELPPEPTIADGNFEFDYWLVNEEEHKNPGDTITVNNNVTVTSVPKRKAAVKVKDGGSVTVSVGKNKSLNVADYITTYGADVTAKSSDTDKITVAITTGKIVFTAVDEGTATVTVACGQIKIEFEVTASAAPVASYTVKVDGTVVDTVDAGDTYKLPAAVVSPDADFKFAGWKVNGGAIQQPGVEIIVEDNVEITAEFERKPVEKLKDGETVNLKVDEDGKKTAEFTVSEYIDKHGRATEISAQSQAEGTATAALAEDKLTITAVAIGNTTVTLTCGNVTVTFNVNVSSVADGTPEFKNGMISFDLFEKTSDSYEFEITALEGSNFSYQYTVTPDTGVSVSGNTLTYTATAAVSNLVLNVSVTATDATYGTKTTSFSVTVNVTDTTPVANNSVVTDSTIHDLYSGALINLTTNIDNLASHEGTYKVNNVDVSDPTAYNVTGTYTETATDVALTVEATFGTKTVTYTYNLKVIDTTAYRLTNGGFENGLDGWTLSNPDLGEVNNATHYWNEKIAFNADGKLFNAYTNTEDKDGDLTAMSGNEGATGTLTSSTFKVGGSGWMTYKLGGAKNINDVYIEVVRTSDDKAVKLPNFDWTDKDLSGCKLVAYKANLIEYGFVKGDEVFVRVVDNAIADYGLFFLDSVVTYYTEAPAGEYSLASKYRLYNGGFETGNLSGWTMTGDIGSVSSVNGYWGNSDENIPELLFKKEGTYFFEGVEGKVAEGDGRKIGTLTSSTFVLGGSGFITFQMGGAKNINEQYIEIVDASNETVLGRYVNTLFNDAGNAGPNGDPNKVSALTLNKYKADLHEYVGKTVYVRIVDNHVGGDFGMVMFDNAVTYYENESDIGGEYILAENKITV